ncbi:MAG: FRG domain-containing protein [Anaerolineae bacterium]|nr:FRG domain-containing protein [Anaerolineae bacterium]
MDVDNITISFESAEDFLDYLQIRKSHWLPRGRQTSPWVFRGQSNADWPLLPSSVRVAAPDEKRTEAEILIEKVKQECARELGQVYVINRIIKRLEREGYDTNLFDPNMAPQKYFLELFWQYAAEIRLVTEFSSFSDELGFSLPAIPGQLATQRRIEEWADFKDNACDNIALYIANAARGRESDSLRALQNYHCDVALAQHHGIPTRLLDWTHKSLVAAYFAAEGVRFDESAENLAVWAINTVHIRKTDLKSPYCLKSQLRYLHAQDSLFLYDARSNENFILSGQWRSFDEVISAYEWSPDEIPLLKIVLPVSETTRLMMLLRAEGITRAHLMPSYDNIALTLKNQWSLHSDDAHRLAD